MLRDNDNNYIGQMISLGQSQHVDPNLLNPIPMRTINAVKSSFAKDAPVADAIHSIGYIKPEYRAFVASRMPKSNQAVSVFLAGATMDKADSTFQAHLLEANQDRDYSALLKTGKDETKDTNIWENISSDQRMVDMNAYFSKLPGGIEIQQGLKQASVNYVLYRAAREGDVNLNGKAQYVEDFIANSAKGFDIATGNNYLFNNSNLSLRKADMAY